MKNIFKIVLVIFIIVIIILVTSFLLYFIEPSYDHSEILTKEEIQSILDKRSTVNNVYVKFVNQQKVGDLGNETEFTEFFVKDSFIKEVATTKNGTLKIMQENKESGEVLWILEDKHTVFKMQNSMSVFSAFEKYEVGDIINQEGVEYIGKTKINDRDTIVLKIQQNWKYKEFIYIDKETGIISKHIMKTLFVTLTNTAEIKMNVVKDDDVKFIDYTSKYPDFTVAGES